MRTFLLFLLVIPSFAQATFPSTTLQGSVTAYAAQVFLASTASVFNPGLPVSNGIGSPSGIQSTDWILLVEQEAICVDLVSGPTIVARRGCQGTATQAHANGTLTWTGPAYYYHPLNPPNATCVASQQLVLPWITLPSGSVFDCTEGSWVLRALSIKKPQYRSKWARIKQWLTEEYP